MKTQSRQSRRMISKITRNIIKAHEATGDVTLADHEQKMRGAVNKAIKGDKRFTGANNYPSAYCCDITTANGDGKHDAIIYTGDGKAVRHGFDYDKEKNEAKMHEGEPKETHMTRIYASMVERHENMIKATGDIISCRAANGTKLDVSEKWEAGKPVSYIFLPGGVSTITAGFRQNETITCTVEVDEESAKDLQESFDHIAATEKQEPYADEDHESKKATLRFPADKIQFTYGTLRNEEGVIVKGAEPTSYGAEAVNGKVYRSWSPEFATDADMTKAKRKGKHWTFPDGVRGSASNPARVIAVNFVTGALTNKPAFKNMPPVKAKKADVEEGESVTEKEQRYINACEKMESESIEELKQEIISAMEAEDCIGIDLLEGKWTAFIKSSGKIYSQKFAFIDSEKFKSIGYLPKDGLVIEEKEEITDADKIVAFDKGFLFNGEVIKAAGTSEGVKKSWEHRERGRLVNKGMGGFLNPPDHPEHHFHIQTDLLRREENRGGMSLSHAATSDYLHPDSRNEAKAKLKEWEKTKKPLEHSSVQDWIHQVHGYFKGMYQGDASKGDESWHAQHLEHRPSVDPMENHKTHAGVHHIQKYYPEYKAKKEHFENAYWGTKPETKASDKTNPSLDSIYAKHEQTKKQVDSIAARIPAAATREATEKIYARLGK